MPGLFNYAKVLKRTIVSKLPTYIVLFVTARCNLKCKMCFYWKKTEVADENIELQLEEIEAISKSFGYIANLAISGGEPFLRDDLDRICHAFYKNNDLRFMNIPTNGSLPDKIVSTTEKILKLCRMATVAIELSMDGVGETHDFIRGSYGAFDNLKETHNRLLKLKKKYDNLWLKINTTFSYYNQDCIHNIISYIKEEMAVDDFYIAMLHGNPKEPMARNFSLDKYINYIKLLEEDSSFRKNGLLGKLLFSMRKMLSREVINVMRHGKFSSPCTALRKIIVIDEVGNVFPCETITDKIGNLRNFNYDIRKIIYSKKRYDLERKYKISSGCNCNWGCAIFNNIIYDVKRWPLLVKNVFF
jgi:radical SAM protein with 4Fe4S-binding SPASM domain